MKRTLFLKHLRANSCTLAREGSKHSIYKTFQTEKPQQFRDTAI